MGPIDTQSCFSTVFTWQFHRIKLTPRDFCTHVFDYMGWLNSDVPVLVKGERFIHSEEKSEHGMYLFKASLRI